jgi:hypothetical protein
MLDPLNENFVMSFMSLYVVPDAHTVHCKKLYLLHTIIALLLTGVLRNILDFLFFVKTYTIHEQFLDLIDFLIFVKMYPIHEQFWFKLKELKQA